MSVRVIQVNHIGSLRKVAIIVPYYQREADILRRCLKSIFAQKTDQTLRMHVIIVDDASPLSAKEELRDVEIPKQITVEIIARGNGGPGAARNVGLDHVSSTADFIAFIDSDDTWRDDHIQRAVDALGTSNDLYFSDHRQWADFSYLQSIEFDAWFGQGSISQPVAMMNGVRVCSNDDLFPYAVEAWLAHISTVVCRRSTIAACRFYEDLRWGGEDHLFFLDLLISSSRTCISTETEVELGFGINIFLSSWSWESENNLRRFNCQFIAQKRIRREYRLSAQLDGAVARKIRGWRVPLSFFILRQLLKGRMVPSGVLLLLFQEDPIFFAILPMNVLRAAAEWAFCKILGKQAFTGDRICN
jgi:succinoglycan biosynthesis protein ExoW